MSGDCLQTLETKDQNIHQAALFLDRDGVINFDYGYVHSKHDFEFIPGIFQNILFRSDGCDDSYCEKFCVDNLSEIITFL